MPRLVLGSSQAAPLAVETLLRRVHRRRSVDRALGADPSEPRFARNRPIGDASSASCAPSGRSPRILASGKTHFDDAGKPVSVSGVFGTSPRARWRSTRPSSSHGACRPFKTRSDSRSPRSCTTPTTQHLVAVGLNLMSLRNRVGGDAENGKLLEEIEGSLDEATKELRTFTLSAAPATAREGRPEVRAAPLRRWLREANRARDPAPESTPRPRSCRSPCSELCFAWFRRRWPTCIVTLRHRRCPSPSNVWPTAFT